MLLSVGRRHYSSEWEVLQKPYPARNRRGTCIFDLFQETTFGVQSMYQIRPIDSFCMLFLEWQLLKLVSTYGDCYFFGHFQKHFKLSWVKFWQPEIMQKKLDCSRMVSIPCTFISLFKYNYWARAISRVLPIDTLLLRLPVKMPAHQTTSSTSHCLRIRWPLSSEG